ncbi:hypothetical protein C5C27_11365 [Rathayibacter sp. AY2B7]|nr:hypothetical protein C5C27_11365 [Rathayibacter sp. AY2B7]
MRGRSAAGGSVAGRSAEEEPVVGCAGSTGSAEEGLEERRSEAPDPASGTEGSAVAAASSAGEAAVGVDTASGAVIASGASAAEANTTESTRVVVGTNAARARVVRVTDGPVLRALRCARL